MIFMEKRKNINNYTFMVFTVVSEYQQQYDYVTVFICLSLSILGRDALGEAMKGQLVYWDLI